MMRLSVMLRLGDEPTPVRSIGMWATLASMATLGGRLLTVWPPTVTSPDVHSRSPLITSASSDCPLPATPAIPRISPERIWNDTPLSAGSPLSFSALTFSTERSTLPGSRGSLVTVKMTLRPTISSANSAWLVDRVSKGSAAKHPLRSTEMRSEMVITSYSLWLIKTMDFPSSVIACSVSKRSSTSCGARTAVGSSMISTSASRYSILRISTRCCSPTESCQILAPGATLRPNRSSNAAIRSSYSGSRIKKRGSSSPSRMFSVTVSEGTSMKCWCTMPMPCSMASRGERKETGCP